MDWVWISAQFGFRTFGIQTFIVEVLNSGYFSEKTNQICFRIASTEIQMPTAAVTSLVTPVTTRSFITFEL